MVTLLGALFGLKSWRSKYLSCFLKNVTTVSLFQIWVDETRQLVYFMGLRDSPLETHLYVLL